MKYLSVAVILIYALLTVSTVVAQERPKTEPKPAVTSAVPVAPVTTTPTLPPPFELRKTGVVGVTKDAAGKVTGIKLIVTSYDIVLDEGSKPLENMDGQRVRVTGTFNMQDGKRQFTVKSVEAAPAEDVKPPVAPVIPPPAKPVEPPAK
jgi:hypothetical protein